ncbi:Nudix family hydrolase [Viridibacterium curvum]|uniref:8-oxo-dGTP diphosphatase n=1 Tax=Viridibacterium curvum TaxID=1101404 RepID=A0ABP9QL48_9RHOO
MVKKVDVSAAVITRPDGRFLLGQRAEGTFYPGYWEFPGGKVEPGETPRDALVRELSEELSVSVREAWPWLMREHHYEHAHVRLHFFEVPMWEGEPCAHVHADLRWQQAGAFTVSPMLPANGPILKALSLPRRMAVTHAGEIGVDAQLAALDRALAAGLRWVQVREPLLDAPTRRRFAEAVLARCRAAGALVVLNGSADEARELGMDGVHLSAAALAALEARPELEWVGASCHTREELERANALTLDYAVLGAIKPTATHADRAAIGWERFHALTRELSLPVIAIGGLGFNDLREARQAGAHGIASIRAAWGEAL